MTESLASEPPSQDVIDLSGLLDLSTLVESVADKQVVFIGESHDQYQHHLNQLTIIQGLHRKHSDIAIGLEFFAKPFQSSLDRYINGEIDEATMLRETEYFQRWRFDYRYYRPIFQYARDQKIPLIALNLAQEITEQVGREGIESLSEEQGQSLPTSIDRDNKAYRERLKEIYDNHPHREGGSFEHFLEVQLLWDEAMAQQAANWLTAHPEGHLVVLAGIGHLMYGDGIPKRLYRRVPVPQAVILNMNSIDEMAPALADYLILAKGDALPPSGKLGVLLDLEKKPLQISGIVEQSNAAAAGLKERDRILAINGQPIHGYADLRIALMDKAVGDRLKISIERDRLFIGTEVKIYDVVLY
jgi:uncharacterized iron-regulated protein